MNLHEASEKAHRMILEDNAQRAYEKGHIRENEIERVVAISDTLWKGQKGNGQATKEAVDIVRKGQDK